MKIFKRSIFFVYVRRSDKNLVWRLVAKELIGEPYFRIEHYSDTALKITDYYFPWLSKRYDRVIRKLNDICKILEEAGIVIDFEGFKVR